MYGVSIYLEMVQIMVGENDIGGLSKREMYAILLKEFEEFKDEGRDVYLEELLENLRKELDSEDC